MIIAVYCGSACGTEPEYMAVARELGDWIGRNGHALVYGGSNTGLMGAVADAVLAHKGKVIGVLPNVPLIHERRHPGLSEYHLMDTMSARKDKMIELSDAYIALFGPSALQSGVSTICPFASMYRTRSSCVQLSPG